MYYDDDVSGGSSGCVRGALIVALALVALGGFVYFSANRATKNIFGDLKSPIAARPTVISVDRPAVIQSIRSLNRLEATTYVADQFIEAGQQGGTLYNLFLGDKLLLIAHGDVIAGFDLAKVRDSDVVMDSTGETVTMTLPPPEILSYKLDNERTKVYDRQRGVATKGDPGLESEARRIAEIEIVRAACEGGALDRANTDGQRDMELLLKSLKFKNVTIKTQPGQCTLNGGAPLPPKPGTQ